MEKSHPGDQYLGFGPRRKGETFPARMLTVAKSDLQSWNICALFREQHLPNTKNRKSNNKDQPGIKTVDCTHVALDFSTIDAKEEFELKLISVLTERMCQLNDAGRARAIAEWEARSPKTVHLFEAHSYQRRDSPMSYRWCSMPISTPPQLDPLGSFASIKLE